MRPGALITLAAIGLLSAGCVAQETQRVEGITPGVGNALAANTVMQMVDPWQYGVQDTDLNVPADRATATAVSTASNPSDSDASASDGGTKTTGSAN